MLPVQQIKIFPETLQAVCKTALAIHRGLDIDWTFKGDPGAGPVHKLPGKGEGNLGQGDGP